jgi:hypothetical protein
LVEEMEYPEETTDLQHVIDNLVESDAPRQGLD